MAACLQCTPSFDDTASAAGFWYESRLHPPSLDRLAQ